jgi:hypothetical protein
MSWPSIRQALAIASGAIDADTARRYGAMFDQDAGFILRHGIKYLLADGGVNLDERAMLEAMKRLDDAWLAACNPMQP